MDLTPYGQGQKYPALLINNLNTAINKVMPLRLLPQPGSPGQAGRIHLSPIHIKVHNPQKGV